MRFLLDTNTCIYIIKRSSEAVFRRFTGLQVGEVGISAITFCELQFGVSNSARPDRNQEVLTRFLGPLDILDFPSGASPVYGEMRAELQRADTPIGNYDLLIAAHALYLGLTLVTHNTKEFKRVSDLRIEDWTE